MATTTKSNPFPPDLLTATEFSSAEEKSCFGNDLVRFVLGGFKPTRFTKRLYDRLNSTFGHIAHFDRGGFFHTWFDTAEHQRSWVEYILEHVPCGDPHYTHSDLERLFKSWLALYRDEVEKIIANNDKKEMSAADKEKARRAALKGHATQQFKVFRKSENTGAFGHTGFWLMAQDGSCYEVAHIQSNGEWNIGDVFDVRLDKNQMPTWDGMCVECPDRKEAPEHWLAKVWG